MVFSTEITDSWRRSTKEERIIAVQGALDEICSSMIDSNMPSVRGMKVRDMEVKVLKIEGNGRVFIRLSQRMKTVERGEFLLDLERRLREKIGPWIEVFLEPQVDANSLRKLRGVSV